MRSVRDLRGAVAGALAATLGCAGRSPAGVERPAGSAWREEQGAATRLIHDAGARREPGDPVVLVVSESGASAGRDVIFAPDASPESALQRCQGAPGYVVLRARLSDARLSGGEVVEQSGLGAHETRCIQGALASIPLRGGLVGEQVIYVRLP